MSTVKVNTVDKRTGSTLTLGGCGTTVTLGAGATQSGFGRTGTVDWCTTAKTSPFTGVSGKGYFVNTTCGAVTVTLPASPSAGDIISIADYASTFQTNNVTLCNNGSKINGVCANAALITQGQSITLVYVDATRGWKNTMDSTSDVTASAYIQATGGTITQCGDYRIHTFTADGTFCVSGNALCASYQKVDYVVIAGGGGGAWFRGGGAGAGGYRESHCSTTSGCYTASPLASATSLPISVQAYPVVVGGGGAGGANGPAPTGPSYTPASQGTPSSFSTITSTGGGYGGVYGNPSATSGGNGGSGGGSGSNENFPGGTPGGTGNTPPVSPPQGNNGGAVTGGPGGTTGAGGGGATGAGGSACAAAGPSPGLGGSSGAGTTSSITGSAVARAGGGAGGTQWGSLTPAGPGGGGDGGGCVSAGSSTNGTANTGGGAGGGGSFPTSIAASGGSGVVIIRYKYQ